MIRLTRALLAVLLISALWSVTVSADVDRPMIEIGSGMEAHPGAPVNVLLRVSIEGVTISNPRSKLYSSLVLARINGNFALSAQADGRRLPFMDIEFIPVDVRTGDGLSGLGFRALPTRLGTNVRMNQGLTVRVDIAGVETSYLGPSGISENMLVFAKVAADAMGYKMATHISDSYDFHGVNIAALSGEAGIAYALGMGLKVRIAFGGTADLSVGGNVGMGFALMSDLSAYNEISLDIKKFMRLFIRNGVSTRMNGGLADTTEYPLLLGATFIF
jgi:hypothetical protein